MHTADQQPTTIYLADQPLLILRTRRKSLPQILRHIYLFCLDNIFKGIYIPLSLYIQYIFSIQWKKNFRKIIDVFRLAGLYSLQSISSQFFFTPWNYITWDKMADCTLFWPSHIGLFSLPQRKKFIENSSVGEICIVHLSVLSSLSLRRRCHLYQK